MSLVDHYLAYAAAFEETYVDDDWSRLEPFFTDDAAYRSDDEPFAFKADGRDAVFKQLKEGIDTFDRKFTSRTLEMLTPPTESGEQVSMTWAVTYSIAGAPDVRMTGSETATFEGDRIKELVDTFDVESGQAVMTWMGEHGAKLQ